MRKLILRIIILTCFISCSTSSDEIERSNIPLEAKFLVGAWGQTADQRLDVYTEYGKCESNFYEFRNDGALQGGSFKDNCEKDYWTPNFVQFKWEFIGLSDDGHPLIDVYYSDDRENVFYTYQIKKLRLPRL